MKIQYYKVHGNYFKICEVSVCNMVNILQSIPEQVAHDAQQVISALAFNFQLLSI